MSKGYHERFARIHIRERGRKQIPLPIGGT